jgi:hypothetical protein
MRKELSGQPKAFELKNKEKDGIITWTTRGQVGRTEGGILATTGFQPHKLSREDLYKKFTEVMKDKREIVYIQSSLRGARAVYDDGGHVDMEYSDKSFRLVYDNKRKILEGEPILNKSTELKLYDSDPWNNVMVCKAVRGCVKITKTSTYNKYLTRAGGKSYKYPLEIGVRAFARWIFARGMKSSEEFNTYAKIVTFVKNYTQEKGIKGVRISKQSLSQLNSNTMSINTIKNTVPNLPEIISFFEYVEKHVPGFNGKDLLEM